jgi:thiol-disulfide isomerase/thioredoxin
MKTSSGLGIFVAAASLLLAAPVAQARLSIGDPAPKLQTGKFVQGDTVTGFDTNHVYIVEFWATWCGPCRASIPHLNELYEKFKDQGLIAIGQDCWEDSEDGVAPFVKTMGDKMTYRVALDDKTQITKGAMAINWMEAAGQNGIPTAFIVDKHGNIAWIGHPMSLTEKVLGEILAGTFDSAGFAKEFEKSQQQALKRNELNQKLRTAMKDKDWDAADAAVAEMEKSVPEGSRFQYGPTHLQILLGRKDYDGAYKLAESLGEKDMPGIQNAVAWLLVTTKGVDQHGLDVAEKIALSANKATKNEQSQLLDTLARAQFMTGKTKEAVATEQKAVDLAPDEMKDYLKKFLASYQQGKLPDINE